MNTTPRHAQLADFLKTRRSRITPAQVGLPQGTRRRTPGLRREEVAQLAGIGLTWYTWLEQGRPIQVSAALLESLSLALLLDDQERQHLFTLARQPLPQELSLRFPCIDTTLQNVLNSFRLSPAFILDPKWNILAWNKAACLVFGEMGTLCEAERNIVWMMFANPAYKSLIANWESHAKNTLARFRASCGQHAHNLWFFTFAAALKEKSAEFAAWWELHDVQGGGVLHKEIRHPLAGTLQFEFTSFNVSDNPSFRMIVNTPTPGTATAEKMEKLSDINQENSLDPEQIYCTFTI